jgi:hypothetical protein
LICYAQYPVFQTVILPLRARVLLCSTCREALRQTMEDDRERAGSPVNHPPVSRRDAVNA